MSENLNNAPLEEDDGIIELEDENGEEIYSSVDDDETADAVFEAFLKLMDEEAE